MWVWCQRAGEVWGCRHTSNQVAAGRETSYTAQQCKRKWCSGIWCYLLCGRSSPHAYSHYITSAIYCLRAFMTEELHLMWGVNDQSPLNSLVWWEVAIFLFRVLIWLVECGVFQSTTFSHVSCVCDFLVNVISQYGEIQAALSQSHTTACHSFAPTSLNSIWQACSLTPTLCVGLLLSWITGTKAKLYFLIVTYASYKLYPWRTLSENWAGAELWTLHHIHMHQSKVDLELSASRDKLHNRLFFIFLLHMHQAASYRRKYFPLISGHLYHP